jgi:hypothetical protein
MMEFQTYYLILLNIKFKLLFLMKIVHIINIYFINKHSIYCNNKCTLINCSKVNNLYIY